MNSFAWWFINLGVSFVWLAIAVVAESWFLALAAGFYLAIAFLVELPGTSSVDPPDEDDWPLG